MQHRGHATVSILQDRLSTEPIVNPYLPPDDIDHTLNEDWERGPVGLNNVTQGLAFQDWHMTFAAGDFTLTPSDEGLPSVVLSGQDSVQCSFAFDQNGQPAIAWIDSSDAGHLWWFDIGTGQPEIFDFQNPATSVALCLDDKRPRQVGVNDILLWFTIPAAGPDHYSLHCRYQRDRFLTDYPMADPVWPYIHKLGMNTELRVQITTSTSPPA